MRAVPSLGCLVLLPILMMMMATAAPLWARSAAAADSGPLQDLLSSISSPGSSASSSGTSRSAPNRSVPSSSAPWNVVILLTLLTMIPAIVLSMTPFVRLLIVFHFLRQALGTQTAPSWWPEAER